MIEEISRVPNREYKLIDKDGNVAGIFDCAQNAAVRAKWLWPDQQQDEARSGIGWDIEVEGTGNGC